jgi:aspartyl-tRNA synthetase
MVKAFEMVGLSKQDVEDRFGGMYRAFQYGAPRMAAWPPVWTASSC